MYIRNLRGAPLDRVICGAGLPRRGDAADFSETPAPFLPPARSLSVPVAYASTVAREPLLPGLNPEFHSVF